MTDTLLTFVDSYADVEEFFRWLGQPRRFLAFDTETEGLDWWRDDVRLIQFGDENRGWSFPFADWRGVAKEVFAKYEGDFAAHNAKFDTLMCEKNDLPIPRSRVHDTRAMAHLIDPGNPTALKSLSARLLDPGARAAEKHLEQLKIRNGWDWRTVPLALPAYWAYAALDTVFTARLANRFWPRISSGFAEVYDLEIASTHVLTDMEKRGVRVDLGYCHRTKDAWLDQAEHLRRQMLTEYGLENPGADRQVAEALIRAGARLTAVTKTGQWKVDKDVLDGIDHPLGELIRGYRRCVKWATTYLAAFEDLSEGEILHANVNPLGARTGRMSCSRPNLQNIPRSEHVRDAFIARDDHALVLCDYDQVELRIMAHFAAEPAMRRMIHEGVDLHTAMAQLVYQSENVTKTQRQMMKNANFAKIYGAGVEKFARTARVDVGQAAGFLASYDSVFPSVRRFQRKVDATIKQRANEDGVGYVKSPVGRWHPVEARVAYKACNYLVQGTAADVLKQALVKLDLAGLTEYACLPVHDEIVFDVPASEAHAFASEACAVMADLDSFSVPVTASSEIVTRWGTKYREAS